MIWVLLRLNKAYIRGYHILLLLLAREYNAIGLCEDCVLL